MSWQARAEKAEADKRALEQELYETRATLAEELISERALVEALGRILRSRAGTERNKAMSAARAALDHVKGGKR